MTDHDRELVRKVRAIRDERGCTLKQAVDMARQELGMGDIFDGTRRKISRHVTRNVADEVLKQKNPEFTERAMKVAEEMLQDPAFHRTIAKSLQRKAVHYMRKYFNSDEFIRRCEAQAKRMIKDEFPTD